MTSFLSKPKKNFVSELLMKYLYGMTIQATGNNQMPVLNITGHIPILLYCLCQIKRNYRKFLEKLNYNNESIYPL